VASVATSKFLSVLSTPMLCVLNTMVLMMDVIEIWSGYTDCHYWQQIRHLWTKLQSTAAPSQGENRRNNQRLPFERGKQFSKFLFRVTHLWLIFFCCFFWTAGVSSEDCGRSRMLCHDNEKSHTSIPGAYQCCTISCGKVDRLEICGMYI
jgi:hypothetical protein